MHSNNHNDKNVADSTQPKNRIKIFKNGSFCEPEVIPDGYYVWMQKNNVIYCKEKAHYDSNDNPFLNRSLNDPAFIVKSDYLEVIVGPPRSENLINSLHEYAVFYKLTIDEAWSRWVEKMSDNYMKPQDNGINFFSAMFSDLLKQDLEVSQYSIGHWYKCFSTNGQYLNNIINAADIHEYTAPTINFLANNILDYEGKPINIKLFDNQARIKIKRLADYLKASWVKVSISDEHSKRKKEAFCQWKRSIYKNKE